VLLQTLKGVSQPAFISKTDIKLDFEPAGLLEDLKGNLYVAGNGHIDKEGVQFIWLLQYNSTGKEVYRKKVGKGLSIQLNKMILGKDGDLILTGSSWKGPWNAPDKAKQNVWLGKVNTAGELKWEQSFGGAKDDRANSLIELQDGKIITVGSTTSKGLGETDIYIIKWSASGKKLWDITDGSGKSDIGIAVADAQDGTFAVTGTSQAAFGFGGKDIYIARIDTTGNKKYDKIKGGGADDGAIDLYYNTDESYTIFGYNNSKRDFTSGWILRINKEVKKWQAESFFPTGKMCQLFPVTIKKTYRSSDGFFWVTGSGFSQSEIQDDDIYVASFNPEGELQSFVTYISLGNDIAIDVLETKAGDLYVLAHNAGTYFLKYKASGQ